MDQIPENFLRLHLGEEDLRQRSLAIIIDDADLTRDLQMIETAMDMLDVIRTGEGDLSEDQTIILLIGASTFNAMCAAIKLMLSGYYQSSILQIRYIMECGWLISYLTSSPELIQRWKFTPEEKRQSLFGPTVVRKALDDRDGFTERKREAHYKRLCVLSGHPTFAGFTMLRPEPEGQALQGPFVVKNMLKACIEELLMVSVTSSQAIMGFFPARTVDDLLARIHYIEKFNAWFASVYDRQPDTQYVDALKELLAVSLESGKHDDI